MGQCLGSCGRRGLSCAGSCRLLGWNPACRPSCLALYLGSGAWPATRLGDSCPRYTHSPFSSGCVLSPHTLKSHSHPSSLIHREGLFRPCTQDVSLSSSSGFNPFPLHLSVQPCFFRWRDHDSVKTRSPTTSRTFRPDECVCTAVLCLVRFGRVGISGRFGAPRAGQV